MNQVEELIEVLMQNCESDLRERIRGEICLEKTF
jgi:hypothetical protein